MRTKIEPFESVSNKNDIEYKNKGLEKQKNMKCPSHIGTSISNL